MAAAGKRIGYRRIARRTACKWCKSRAGKYSLADAPEAFRRHENCDCDIKPIHERKDAAAKLERMETADAYGVTLDQLEAARPIARDIKADIRRIALAEADDLDYRLHEASLGELSRPGKLRLKIDDFGSKRYVRDKSGYDWMEQLTPQELRRVKERFTDSVEYAPDLMAERVSLLTNRDFGVDEAMNYVLDEWLREDGLRSVAHGINPKYVDIDTLLPNDYEARGFKLSEMFGVDLDDAAGHVAQVLADEARDYAERSLGRPELGPAPWTMTPDDFVFELDYLSAVVTELDLDDPVAADRARRRLQELAPADVDDGRMNPYELFDEIRSIANLAGL